MPATRLGLVCCAGLGLVSAAPAQVPLRPVGPPSAKLSHPFSSISGFRELPDGRVVVSDGIDQVVVVANWTTGRLDTLGRVGQGPGEYRAPDALVALPDGATLVVDLGNARLSTFEAGGKYRASVPIAEGQPVPGRPGGMSMILPRGSDNQGRLYFQPMGSVHVQADSAPVLRWDRVRNTTDTVAKVKVPDVVTQSSGGANNQAVRQRNNPYPTQDSWAVAPDGRLALIRAPIYRVDWVGPDRKVVTGQTVPLTAVALTKADKLDWLSEQAMNGLRVQVENRNGQVSMSFRRGGGGDQEPTERDLDQYVWPAKKPPFVSGSALVGPDGRLWVERSMPSGTARSYDVFDASGALVARVGLPAGRRLVGVGRGGLYVKSVDDGGISQLERYPIPG